MNQTPRDDHEQDRAEQETIPPERIEAPAGLNLHPQPKHSVRVSKRAGMAIGAIGMALMIAFAYGAYRRQVRAQDAARESGLPKSVAPATTAGNEFLQEVPAGNALVARKDGSNELQPPGSVPSGNPTVGATPCGFDPRTAQPYRFNPNTGQPCEPSPQLYPQDRVVVRQAPPAQPLQAQREPTPEERRIEAAYQREHEAMLSPTGIRSGGNGSSGSVFGSLANGSPARPDDLAQVAALGQALGSRNADGSQTATLGRALLSSGSSAGDSDYDGQNMQTRKEAFLNSARSQKTEDYLRSTRSAPLGTYEIKAGWEIPAVLEQSLNSDLPGELKALVMSNVYDTATGRYLLIPQGSRLIGKYDSRVSYGQDGVEVVWDRILYPDASSVDINGMVGLDSHGNAGLRDKVDRHYKRLFGFAALTSAFSAAFDLSQRRGQQSALLSYPSIGDTASASVGREISQTGSMITRRNLNVQPTIKVPVGYKFTVRVNRDILFDAPYEPMQADPQPLTPGDKQLRRRTSFSTVKQ